jgi:hypothetical protein
MLKLADRVKQTSITTGSGLYVELQDTFGGYQSFQSSIGDGNTTYYAIENGTNFEVGIGTYSSSGNTLSRNIILESSNNQQKIYLDGVSIVFCTYPAEKSFILNGNGYASGLFPHYKGIAFPDGSIQETASTASDDNYCNINSSTTLSTLCDIVFVDTSSGDITITMPTAINSGGKKVVFKRKLGSNNLTILPIAGQSIDGSNFINTPYAYQSITLISDGLNWYII